MIFNPFLSVIIPTYNSSNFIEDTIQSILDQSYKNFELLILDDCSQDDTFEKIKNFKDKRIRLLKNEFNRGYVFSLNKLISISKGDFIVRNDHDDISIKKRFEIQLKEFKKNKDLFICGGQIETIELKSKKISYPIKRNDLISFMFFNNPIHHPTVMIKSAMINLKENFYDENFCPSEDYYKWSKIISEFQIINSQKKLLLYRSHSNNYSKISLNKQKKKNLLIRNQYYKQNLGITLTDEINLLINALIYNENIDLKQLKVLKSFFKLLKNKSREKKYHKNFKTIISFFWLKACFFNLKKANFFLRIQLFLEYPNFSFILKRYLIKKILC